MPDRMVLRVALAVFLVAVLPGNLCDGGPMIHWPGQDVRGPKSKSTQHRRDHQRTTHDSLHFTAKSLIQYDTLDLAVKWNSPNPL